MATHGEGAVAANRFAALHNSLMGTYETCTGRSLDALAKDYGLVRKVEDDYELRERLRAISSTRVGTLYGIDAEVRILFMRVLPVATDHGEVRQKLALLWLRGERPLKWRKRVRWYWGVLRELFGPPFRG